MPDSLTTATIPSAPAAGAQAAQADGGRPAPSLERLFARYGDMVFRICLRYAKDREDAEELAQEVFIKVHRNLAAFRGLCHPMTWIYRIAVNHCLSHLRARKRQRDLFSGFLDHQVERNLRDHGPGVLAKVTLEKVLDKVNPVTRKVLFLHYAEGQTHDEIARNLGVSRVAVTKRIAKFHASMAGRFGVPGPRPEPAPRDLEPAA